jgi:HEPN domain-containing protein
MTDIDHARRLLVMAGKDLSALRAMDDTDTFPDEIFGFHAQQAVEKTLKAWIALLGGTYPLTHDLRLLIVKLEELECVVDSLWDFLELSSFAVQFRYEEVETGDVPLDRDSMVSSIDGLFRSVRESVDSEESCR